LLLINDSNSNEKRAKSNLQIEKTAPNRPKLPFLLFEKLIAWVGLLRFAIGCGVERLSQGLAEDRVDASSVDVG
jgi:hypothetical protein